MSGATGLRCARVLSLSLIFCAAVMYLTRVDGEQVRRASERLLDEARRHGVEVHGEPAFAGYDAPFTLPVLRRNEVWVEVVES